MSTDKLLDKSLDKPSDKLLDKPSDKFTEVFQEYYSTAPKKELGKGSFASVYSVPWQGKLVAVKELRYPDNSEDPESTKIRAMIAKERAIQRFCSGHPCVINHLGDYETTTSTVLVMECGTGSIDGNVRHNKKHGQSFTEVHIISALVQILLALDYMHNEKKTVHRDIKPANVFVNGHGLLKMGDFGLSSCFATTCASEEVSAALGTMYYMAPELYMRRGKLPKTQDTFEYLAKTDVWAMGILMHELMSGDRPFTGTRCSRGIHPTARELAQEILEYPVPYISRTFSHQLNDLVCTKMLAKDQAERATVSELFETATMQLILYDFIKYMEQQRNMPEDIKKPICDRIRGKMIVRVAAVEFQQLLQQQTCNAWHNPDAVMPQACTPVCTRFVD